MSRRFPGDTRLPRLASQADRPRPQLRPHPLLFTCHQAKLRQAPLSAVVMYALKVVIRSITKESIKAWANTSNFTGHFELVSVLGNYANSPTKA